MDCPPSRLRALETARECAALGARMATIAYLTGLSPHYILHHVYSEARPAPRGRPRCFEEFYFRANARLQAEASLLAAHYRRLRGEGFVAAAALVCAFRHLRSTAPAGVLLFDEGFFLVSRLDGIWATRDRSLDLVQCAHCQRPHLVALGSTARDRCPFCRADWTRRAAPSRPMRAAAAPVRERPPDLPVDGEIARGRLVRLLQDLGAGPRVTAVLCGEPRTARHRKPTTRRTVTEAGLSWPLRVERWSSVTPLAARVQYCVFAVGYRRLQRLGLPRPQAMGLAVARMRDACRALCPPVSFDRCFEVAAQLEGAWGVEDPALALGACATCGSHFLVGRRERGTPGCPFCALVRRHRALSRASAATA